MGREPAFEVEPGAEETLRAAGLDGAEAILSFRDGELVNAHASREVRRVEAGGAVLYIKRHANRSARRERGALRALAARGVAAAEPLALAEAGRRSALVTRGVPDGCAIDEAISSLDRTGRRAVAAEVARLVRRLHEADFSFPDLYAKHVVLDGHGRPHLVDLERLERGATAARRARDLAALDLTSEIAGAGRTDRVAFLRAYAVDESARALSRRVAAARKRLERKRRFHRHRLVVRENHRAALETAGLATFEDYRSSPSIVSVRRLPGRENVRVEAGGRTYYGRRVPASGLDEVRREWAALLAFAREGLPGPEPVVLGTDPVEGGFVFTAEVPGRPLDDLLREGAVPPGEQRDVARALGALVRRLHALGFWHRDLYPCHVFAASEADGWRLTLIDLARVGRKERPRSRWFVKDLAALWHGTPREAIRGSSVATFLRAYTGRRPLGLETRRLVRRVLRKARRMARHVPKAER